MRSISLVGNMLGNGTRELPQWIHSDEHQPFLYVSSSHRKSNIQTMVQLAAICALCGWPLLADKDAYRQILFAKAGTDLTCEAHMFLLQMGVVLSVVAGFLLSAYYAGATYYICGSIFASTTLSNFSDPTTAERWWSGLFHSCGYLDCVWRIFLRRTPTPTVAEREETTTWWDWFLKFVYSSWSVVSMCCKYKFNLI